MIAQARERLLAYPNVTFVAATALAAATHGSSGFLVSLDKAEQLSAAKLVLAFGVHDELPDIPGLPARWGASVLHCPYCHGYEFGGQRLGVLYRMPLSVHQAQLIADWGPTTLYLNGDETLEDSERANLQARGIAIESGRVIALEGAGLQLEGVRVEGGRLVPLDALYLAPRTHMRSPLAGQLGCAFDDGPLGPVIRTDATKMTTVPGVYAAGDAAQMMQNASLASADGVLAGVSLHQALVFGG